MQTQIGALFRAHRKLLKWSQNGLARKVDVNQVTIARIETGGHTPPLWLFARLIDALHVDQIEAVTAIDRTRTGNLPRDGRDAE